MFVDATFSCVSAPFHRCLIIMVYDKALCTYIHVMWILVTGKTKECYCQAFTYIKGEVPTCDPFCVGVDFERAFLALLGAFFKTYALVWCLFCFKQAARRKMMKLGIAIEEIILVMTHGIYDLLTILPKDELEKGEYLLSRHRS